MPAGVRGALPRRADGDGLRARLRRPPRDAARAAGGGRLKRAGAEDPGPPEVELAAAPPLPRRIRHGGEWYVRATSVAAGIRKLVLKDDDTFLVVDQWGDLPHGVLGELGLFRRDTRHLSVLELRVLGHRPLVLASRVEDDSTRVVVDLTMDDVPLPDGRLLSRHTLFLHRTLVLDGPELCHEVAVHCYADEEVAIELELDLGSDFADLFEVRGTRRERRGTVRPPARVGRDGVLLAYRGVDGVERVTGVRLHPPPDEVVEGRCLWRLRMRPGEDWALGCVARAGEGEPTAPAGTPLPERVRRARRRLDERRRLLPSIRCSDPALDEVLQRALDDVALLLSRTEEGWYPVAGIPWYATPFGRDGLWTAWMCLPWAPALAQDVLRHLARHQASADDAFTDAEPGKILHEIRFGEMAACREIPFVPYYGTVDATPLFVTLAAATYRTTGDEEALAELWPALERALGWVLEHGDLDGDGLLEYRCRSPVGLRNQGWKDSFDSIHHEDGALAEPPVALAEVQAYAHRALLDGAELATALGHGAEAARWKARAKELRARVLERFWLPARRTYAQALDAGKRPCAVVASHLGHLLWAGVVPPEHLPALRAELVGPGLFSGYGVRTLARGERRYNPVSYHNGSIWPHDNAIAAAGLRRYGATPEALRIASAVLDAIVASPDRRAPELFSGFDRTEERRPVPYPVACAPQAWAAAAVLSFVRTACGLAVRGRVPQVVFTSPALFSRVERVEVRGLAAGRGTVDFAVRRGRYGASVELLDKSGGVDVVVHG